MNTRFPCKDWTQIVRFTQFLVQTNGHLECEMKQTTIYLLLCLFGCFAAVSSGFAQDRDIDRTPKNCVVVRDIRRTTVVDEHSILFYMGGGTIYRNYLPRACPSLAQQKRFMYRASVGRLCDVDWIDVIYNFGGGLDRGPSCGLGKFYEISKEEAEILKTKPPDILKEPEKVDLESTQPAA